MTLALLDDGFLQRVQPPKAELLATGNFRAQLEQLVQNSLVLTAWMPSLRSKSPGEWGARDHAVVCDM